MLESPICLCMSLGEVFTDATVARLYERRPPYPEGVFTTLARRLVAPRTVLDAGAGTGALARRMTFAERVDAIEPSAAMVATAPERAPASATAAMIRARARREARSAATTVALYPSADGERGPRLHLLRDQGPCANRRVSRAGGGSLDRRAARRRHRRSADGGGRVGRGARARRR
jgi:SAM-dependent methyltransferase